MNTFKTLAAATLLLGNSLFGQNFTNEVNTSVNVQRSFTYTYSVDPNLKIDKPLLFRLELEGSPSATVAASLIHQGTTYTLFDGKPARSEMSSGPIDAYLGKYQGGSWVFSIQTDNPIFVKEWSIVPFIPEPSTFSLAVVGGAILGFLRKRK